MSKTNLCLAILALGVAIGFATTAHAEKRVALLVGNNAYQNVPRLQTAVNDARAVGTALRGLGFSVIIAENQSRRAMSEALLAFDKAIEPGDIALFFFAGHGFEIRGQNYLLPTDIPEVREGQEELIRDSAFPADRIIDRLQGRGSRPCPSQTDRVIVLRDGRIVGHLEGDAVTHDAMVKLMVGRDLKVAYAAPASERGDVVLSVQKLRTTTFPFAEVSIDFHSGEILGLAGLVGAGRTELAHALFGIDATEGGTVLLDGAPVRFASSTDAVRAGVFLVPEDRKRMGLLVDFAITENITLPNLSAYARGLTISREAERARANKSRGELDIRAPDLAARTGSLSGGNQQKIVLAKWLAMNPRVIIFDEPTRGIDVGAKSEIYRLMRTLADAGVAVLMISSDMEEVIGVSDRVAVMHQGRISGILARAQCREENILQLAVGKGVAEPANWAGKTQC